MMQQGSSSSQRDRSRLLVVHLCEHDGTRLYLTRNETFLCSFQGYGFYIVARLLQPIPT